MLHHGGGCTTNQMGGMVLSGNIGIDFGLKAPEDFLVINALFHEEPLPNYFQRSLKRLTEMGIVEHMGRNKYVLARGLYAAAGKSGVHTRVVGLDRSMNKELLLKHIRESGEQVHF